MKVVITGGTGFIGRALTASLMQDGHDVTVFTRSETVPDNMPNRVRYVRWNPLSTEVNAHVEGGEWQEALAGSDAVVHLAGESIAARRWSPEQKQRIRDSRILGTRRLVEAMMSLRQRPQVLVSGSAVGIYGNREDQELTESSVPGNDFLADVCTSWEAEARQAEAFGIRVVQLRTGIVLDRQGGALPRMLLPFRLFVGGPLGTGRQWMPWIHLDDEVGMIRFAIENEQVTGALNAVSPRPVTNRDFCMKLGKVMGRPCWAPVPASVLKLVLGEMADPLLLSGQRVVPQKALDLGYEFRHVELESALRSVLRR